MARLRDWAVPCLVDAIRAVGRGDADQLVRESEDGRARLRQQFQCGDGKDSGSIGIILFKSATYLIVVTNEVSVLSSGGILGTTACRLL